jgi:hypothetical protein
MRTGADQLKFAAYLLSIGNGTAPTINPTSSYIELPYDIVVHRREDLIEHVFPKSIRAYIIEQFYAHSTNQHSTSTTA